MIIRNAAPRRLGRQVFFCLLAGFIFAAGPQAANAAGDLTVEEFSGPVKLKMDDRWQDPQVGMSVPLPATVSTGDDGSIKLAQDGSVFSIAANTALEIFASPDSGQLVTRVVQSKGSAFYDISNREHRKLRVETPYLAAVIKGTQFNVTVEPERSSIALYEGLLRIEAPDIGEAIDLRAGFIARRQEGDTTITVIPMDGGEAASGKRSGIAPDSGNGSSRAASLPGESGGIVDDAFGDGGTDAALGVDSEFGPSKDPLILETTSSGDFGSGELGTDLDGDATIGDLADLDAGVDADLGSGEAGADLGTEATVGDVADLGADAGVDADLGTGEVGADLGTDADVAGVDTGLDANVDADLGSGEVGTDASVGDVGLDVGADLGTLDEATDVGDGLLGGEDTTTGDTAVEEEQEEDTPLLDPGDLLRL